MVVGGVALVTAATGLVAVRTGRWPPRPALYAFAALLVFLAAFGLVTYVEALGDQPTPA